MSVALETPEHVATLADLMARLGDLPQERILASPPLGSATEKDVLAFHARHRRLCELVDGVLVEKAMSYEASVLAMYLGAALIAFVNPRRLGVVSGSDGMMRLFARHVRIPDVAYASWSRFPGGRVPTQPIPDLVPDLAAEVLSPGNTPGEMSRKLTDYFGSGVRLVWIVDPTLRIVAVHTSPEEPMVQIESQTLDGGDLLPGFQLSLAELFGQLDGPAESAT